MRSYTENSDYGLNLSIILMFLTLYGVEKRSVTTAIVIERLELLRLLLGISSTVKLNVSLGGGEEACFRI